MMDKMKTQKFTDRHLGSDDVSFYLDADADELVSSKWLEISNHLLVCEECRKQVRLMQRLDDCIRDVTAVPADLAGRIKEACHARKTLESTPAWHWWNTPGLWKVAVAAAFVCLLGYGIDYGRNAVRRQTHDSPRVSQMQANVDKQDGEALPTTEGMRLSPSEKAELYADNMKRSTRLFPEEMQAVGMQGGNNGSKTHNARYYLSNLIHHVWLVDNLEQGRQYIDNLAAQGSLEVEWLEGGSSSSIKGRLLIEDRCLQKIVDEMTGKHWALLSPNLPQPGKKEKIQFLGKELVYEISIVQKE